MTLGPDGKICASELQTALRPLAGDAVDEPPAADNLAALGTALYRILTADAHLAYDAAFLDWLKQVGNQTGVGPPPSGMGRIE